jgi:hypothetical protein
MIKGFLHVYEESNRLPSESRRFFNRLPPNNSPHTQLPNKPTRAANHKANKLKMRKSRNFLEKKGKVTTLKP